MATVKVDDEVMTEDEFQRRLNISCWGGRSSSLEAAAAMARQKSGVAYSVRKDEDARRWREVAEWLEELACGERKIQSGFNHT